MMYVSEVKIGRPIKKDSYLWNVPAIEHLIRKKSLPLTHDVTFFVGENGTGKSTLLEAIALVYRFANN